MRRRGRGCPALPQGGYTIEHPQHLTHLSRQRCVAKIPVLLSDTLPRPDCSPEEHERWCRAMTILFKPWRLVTDIKGAYPTWKEAFNQACQSFPENVLEVVKNIMVENECQDAHETYDKQHREGRITRSLMGGFVDVDAPSSDMSSLCIALMNDERIQSYTDKNDYDMGEDVNCMYNNAPVDVREALASASRAGMFQVSATATKDIIGMATTVQDHELSRINTESRIMQQFGSNKRPTQTSVPPVMQSHAMWNAGANTSLSQLETHMVITETEQASIQQTDPLSILEEIITEKKIQGNIEQERAFRIVGEHFVQKNPEQLFLYIAGVGRTGKSHVIHAIMELFNRCGRTDEILLSAPTGCTAVLINGFTIHALTLLPKSKWKHNQNQLEEIWQTVRYLIIDEISMISAKLLTDISSRIQLTRGWNPEMSEKLFRGVNMIFSGDFGQLRPVQAASLFSHNLVEVVGPNVSQNEHGQRALHGASLWRQIDQVVELKTNMRSSSDHKFVNLLAHVRIGRAWDGHTKKCEDQLGNGDNYADTGYEVLRKRCLQSL